MVLPKLAVDERPAALALRAATCDSRPRPAQPPSTTVHSHATVSAPDSCHISLSTRARGPGVHSFVIMGAASGTRTPEGGTQVTSDAFDDRDLLLGYYQTQADEFRLRHAAIWEEIRHYTWLLSLLLSWPVALLSAKDLNQLWQYAPYFVFLPALGLCFSIIAFFVIRREYRFYNESDAKLLYVEKALGLTSRDDFLDKRLRKAARDGFTVDEHVREQSPVGTYLPWKAKIRALFLLEFIVFAVVSTAEILFCTIAFFHAP
jgi:hypothetical protein